MRADKLDELSKLEDSSISLIIENDVETQFLLGTLFIAGSRTFTKDSKRAAFWYQKAAEQGHEQAQYMLGSMYMAGAGIEKNEKIGCHWFEMAAKQGDEQAQQALACNYLSGKGVEKDETKFFYWTEQAAGNGNLQAQNNLASCYQFGIGVKKDLQKAVEGYMTAAKQGMGLAQYNLAYCLLNGMGIDKDFTQAAVWLKNAAKQRLPVAQYELGKLYATGQGVEKDEKKADWWFKKAAKNGYVLAKNWLNEEIGYSADFLTEQAKWSEDCYVPCDLPPPVFQWGPYCGLAAFAAAINYSGCLPYPLYATEYEKAAAGQSIEIKDDILLHQLKYNIKMKDKWRTTEGEIFNVKLFKKLAKHYGIKGCEAIIQNYSEKEYTVALREALKDNYTLIIACDSFHALPVQDQAKSAHWVWSPSYDSDSLGVSHRDLYAKWTTESLYQSNQMPEKNPHKEGGDLLKFKGTFFKVPVNHERLIIRDGVRMKSVVK